MSLKNEVTERTPSRRPRKQHSPLPRDVVLSRADEHIFRPDEPGRDPASTAATLIVDATLDGDDEITPETWWAFYSGQVGQQVELMPVQGTQCVWYSWDRLWQPLQVGGTILVMLAAAGLAVAMLWPLEGAQQPPEPDHAVQAIQVASTTPGTKAVRGIAKPAKPKADRKQTPTPAEKPPRQKKGKAAVDVKILADEAKGAVLAAQPGHGNVTDENTTEPGRRVPKRQNRRGPDLEIGNDVFTGEQTRGLIDDWLVPMLVDGLVRQLLDGRQEG
jgi:hypothetical protein